MKVKINRIVISLGKTDFMSPFVRHKPTYVKDKLREPDGQIGSFKITIKQLKSEHTVQRVKSHILNRD